jgi:probable phosphoglycerate mutase
MESESGIIVAGDPNMTEIIFIRHGETQENRDGRIQGHSQTLLNELGREQARRLGERMRGAAFDALYSSDLLRARATADAVAAHHALPVIEDPRLREWDLGVLTGLTRPDAQRRHPDAYAIYRDALVERVVPDGESIRGRYQRIIAAVEALAARHPGATIVVVSHGGPLGDCYRHATGMPLDAPKDFQLYNAGINRFAVEGRDWRLLAWADIAHLQGLDTLGNWEGQK